MRVKISRSYRYADTSYSVLYSSTSSQLSRDDSIQEISTEEYIHLRDKITDSVMVSPGTITWHTLEHICIHRVSICKCFLALKKFSNSCAILCLSLSFKEMPIVARKTERPRHRQRACVKVSQGVNSAFKWSLSISFAHLLVLF